MKMKKNILTLLCCLVASIADAQQLTALHQTIDCGKSGFQQPVSAVFELKNESRQQLLIDDIKVDCGCIKPEVSKTHVAPGESFTVKLTYDGRMLGHYVKQASVQYQVRGNQHLTNEQEPQALYLKMKGVVLSEVKDYSGIYPFAMGELLADRNEVEFDNVNKGDSPEIIINVMNNSDRPMVPNVQHLPVWLTAQASPEKLSPGRSGKVKLKLNTKAIHDFGLTQSQVYLASQLGEKVQADNELPISVVLLPDLKTFEGKNKQYAPKMTLSATEITLGKINGKMKKKADILLKNTGRTDLQISSLQMFTAGLRLTLNKRTLRPGEQAKLKVAVADRNRLLKSRTKPRVLMITNDPDQSKVVIHVTVK